MKKFILAIILIGLVLFTGTANTQSLDADTIMNKMISVLEDRTLSYKVNIVVNDGTRVVSRLLAGGTRKRFPEGNRSLLVMLEPVELKGIAYLFRQQVPASIEQWVYIPSVGRVRKIGGVIAYESFLGTDFAYTDLGLLDRKGTHKLLGEEEIEGVSTYKIETIPEGRAIYYSRILTWVNKNNFIPVQKEYYDVSDKLWKRQLYENITVFDNVPIPLLIRMLDLQNRTSTEFRISEVTSDVSLITDEIFVPEQLKYSLKCPVWQRVCYLPEDKK